MNDARRRRPAQPNTRPEAVPTEPRARKVLVTPELAKVWLSPDVHPKNRRPRRVDYFVYVINSGQFKMTGEPIQFAGFLDDNFMPMAGATLLNGQNRLEAIIRTDKPQWIFVVDGLDPSIMAHLDRIAPRTFADNLEIAKVTNSKTAASIGNLLMILTNPDPGVKRSLITGGGRAQHTVQDQMDYFMEHRAVIEESYPHARRLREAFRMSEAAAAAAWVLIHERTATELDDVDDFFTRFAEEGPTGVRSRDKRGPVPPLEATRRWFTNQVRDVTQANVRPRPTVQVAIIIKGWNFEQQGHPVENLRWRTYGTYAEEFPDVL